MVWGHGMGQCMGRQLLLTHLRVSFLWVCSMNNIVLYLYRFLACGSCLQQVVAAPVVPMAAAQDQEAEAAVGVALGAPAIGNG